MKLMKKEFFMVVVASVIICLVGLSSAFATEAYWVDAAGNRITELNLVPGEQQVIRFAAEVPAQKKLMAFQFGFTFNPDVVEFVPITENDIVTQLANFSIGAERIEGNVLIVNGANVYGVPNPAMSEDYPVELVEMTLKAKAVGTFEMTTQIESFGESEESEFKPDTVSNLTVTVTDSTPVTPTTTNVTTTVVPVTTTVPEMITTTTTTVPAESDDDGSDGVCFISTVNK
jgi:hypothetical protein